MKRNTHFTIIAVILLTLVAFAGTSRSLAGGAQRVLVEFQPGSKGAVKGALLRAGGNVHFEFDNLNVIAVTLPTNALKGIGRNPNIVSIEKDTPRYLMAETIPWGIEAVQAPAMHTEGVTGAGATVCIIDSGIHIGHEDLNSENINGQDVSGTGPWNVDYCGHGTHVAGTIAAAANNNLGVIGAATDVSLYIVKVFGDDCGWAYTSSLMSAANICAANGADIISMSLGGGQKNRQEEKTFDNLHSQGILSIAAAGNDGNTAYSYPASYDSVVSVTAIDEDLNIADFSQQNDQVELAAPGVAVLSTVPWIATNELTVNNVTYDANHIEFAAYGNPSGALVDGGLCDSAGSWNSDVVLCERGAISFYDKVMNVESGGGIAAVIYNNEPGNFSGTMGADGDYIIAISLSQADGQFLVANKLGLNGDIASSISIPDSDYEAWNGTSMATPHVSSVAALLKSAFPTLTNAEIRDAMVQTAYDLGITGKDNAFGYGLVQAYDAWVYLGGGNQSPVASFTFNCTELSCNFDASGSYDPDGSIVSYAWDFGDGNTGSDVATSHAYATDGSYTVTLTVTDNEDATDDDSQTVNVGSGGADMMHVSAIDMWYSRAGRNYTVYTRVTIVDENNALVSGATVSLEMTLPGGSTASDSSVTGSDGTVTFSIKSKTTGTYTSEVMGVTHATLTYAPGDNVETSESLSVP